MSSINGDKSRAGRQRKTRFEKRERNRLLRKSLTAPAAGEVAPKVETGAAPEAAGKAKPVAAAAVIVAPVPANAAAHAADNKKEIVQYPRKRSA
jgi:D-tyrosyl-tRNA(Tyr) deacylase